MTTLMFASDAGHFEVACLLLEAGAGKDMWESPWWRHDRPDASISEWSLGDCTLASGSWC